MGARWISYLRKREMEAIWNVQTGSVYDPVLEIAGRLQECEAEILAVISERKKRPSRVTADVGGDMETNSARRDIFAGNQRCQQPPWRKSCGIGK